jgi:hypothetical protein
MENLDLNISNYSVTDLETFLRLPVGQKYTHADVELYESKIRNVLLNSGNVDKRFQRDLIAFLEAAKRMIIDARGLRPPAPSAYQGNGYLLDPMPNVPIPDKSPFHREGDLVPHVGPNVIYTQNSEYIPGTINPIDKRTITKCLTIDTRFRGHYHSTNCADFTIQLPTKFSKVISMKLSSFEIPVAFYGISKHYGNNFLYMRVLHKQIEHHEHHEHHEYGEDISGACIDVSGSVLDDDDANSLISDIISDIHSDDEMVESVHTVIIPDGNYNAADLVEILNQNICPRHEHSHRIKRTDSIFSYLEFVLDINFNGCGSGKLILKPTGKYAKYVMNVILDFRVDMNGKLDGKDYTSKLGWNLGFTREKYNGYTSYISDTIMDPASVRYLYLVVDDFNNNVNNPYITAFNQSISTPNILARISVKGSFFSLLMENDLSVVNEARQYFGPVDIQRLRIRLIDDRGRTVDMNGANYSICLLLTQLYDV